MNGRAWLREDCADLEDFQKRGVRQAFAARVLGRSVSAVKNKASDAGFLQPKRGKWTAEEESMMFRLIASGYGADATGYAIGRTGRAVRAYLNRIGMSCAAIIEGAKSVQGK